MSTPPWKRDLPPEPPRREGFLSPSSHQGTENTSRLSPLSPPSGRATDANSKQKLTENSSRKGKRSSATSKLGKRSPVVVLCLFVVLIGGVFLFVNRNETSNQDVDSVFGSLPTETATSTSIESAPGADIAPQGMWDKIAQSVVYIEAIGAKCGWSGSGSIVLDGSYILTNHHVSGSGECQLSVFLTDSSAKSPIRQLAASLIVFDKVNDLAVLRMFDSAGTPFIDNSKEALVINSRGLQLGAKVFTLGYPAAGGSTITFTSGDFAGMDDTDGVFYKTTAYMNSGVSGGAGLNEQGQLIGVPTAGKIDGETNEKLGINLIRPISYANNLLDTALTKNIQEPDSDMADSSATDSSDSVSETVEVENGMDPIFDTCGEAKGRGYGPYYSGSDSEYNFYQDRDQDGIVCE